MRNKSLHKLKIKVATSVVLISLFLANIFQFSFSDVIGTWDEFLGYQKWTYLNGGSEETVYINDMAYNGKTYVAVGSRATVLVTDDVYKWADYPLYSRDRDDEDGPRYEMFFKKVIWNGKYYMILPEAIDLRYNFDDYFTSLDGYHWERHLFNHKYDGMQVADALWDGKKMIILLYTNPSCTGLLPLYSYDGLTWKEGKVSSVYKIYCTVLNSIATNGKIYVGVGARFSTSKDGINWVVSPSGQWGNFEKGDIVGDFNQVIWDGKQFVAVGVGEADQDDQFGVVMTSKDGLKWTVKQRFLEANLKTIVFDGTDYRISGDYSDYKTSITKKYKKLLHFKSGMILNSKDLVNWQVEKDKIKLTWVNGSKYFKSEYFIFGNGVVKSNTLQVRYNDKLMSFSKKPILVNQKVLVPYKEVLVPLGYDAQWDKLANKLIIKKDSIECILDFSSNTLSIGDKIDNLEDKFVIEKNNLLISPQEILSSLGFNIKYDAAKLRLLIEDPEYTIIKNETSEMDNDE